MEFKILTYWQMAMHCRPNLNYLSKTAENALTAVGQCSGRSSREIIGSGQCSDRLTVFGTPAEHLCRLEDQTPDPHTSYHHQKSSVQSSWTCEKKKLYNHSFLSLCPTSVSCRGSIKIQNTRTLSKDPLLSFINFQTSPTQPLKQLTPSDGTGCFHLPLLLQWFLSTWHSQ